MAATNPRPSGKPPVRSRRASAQRWRTDAQSVFLTGASGFVGSHVLRELLAAGHEVLALTRGSPALDRARQDAGPGRLRLVPGEMENVGGFARALNGCRYVVHCAALYSFAPAERARMHAVNVKGTASLAEAARVARVERFVLTSSSAALGASGRGETRTEDDWAHGGGAENYHHSKLDQERAAFAAQLPVVALLPTAPVGPGDSKPTPTGKMILDFARGKMFSLPPCGGMNLVPVEDVARAHVSALRQGSAGGRYILGGENLMLDEVWELLASVTQRPLPRFRAPHALAMAMAYADEARCRLVPHAVPHIPLEGVRMSVERMFADSSKAQRELGFRAGPVRAALERSVEWFRAHRYL
ncbi:MAG: NAD-dependent epimerase/dehydratase family protein [Candidatus Baltobacteraceae bacterium]